MFVNINVFSRLSTINIKTQFAKSMEREFLLCKVKIISWFMDLKEYENINIQVVAR